MTLEDNVQRNRLRVLQRAQELGNVSAACRKGLGSGLYFWCFPTPPQICTQEGANPPALVVRELGRSALPKCDLEFQVE